MHIMHQFSKKVVVYLKPKIITQNTTTTQFVYTLLNPFGF